MSSWKRISLKVLIFIILLLGIVIFLTTTTFGLHLLFSAANRWIQEQGIEIGQITGSCHDMYLRNICYQRNGVLVNIGEFHLAIKISHLYNKKICVEDLSLKKVKVIVDSKKIPVNMLVKEKNSNSLTILKYCPIKINRLSLNNLNVKIDDITLSIIDFISGISWQNGDLTIIFASLQGMLVNLPKITNKSQKDTPKYKIHNLQTHIKPLRKDLKSTFFNILLPKNMMDISLPLNFNIKEFKGKHLHIIGNVNLLVSNLLVKMSGIKNNIKLDVLNIDTNYGCINAKGNLLLQDNWPIFINMKSIFNKDPFKGEKIDIKIIGKLRDNLDFSVNFSGLLDVELNGKTKPTEVGIPLNIEAVSNQSYWSFIHGKKFQFDNMKLKISGKINDYIIYFYMKVKKQNAPPAIISLNAKGNEHQINIDNLTLETLNGKTELTAFVNWQQTVFWHGNLKVKGINITREIFGCPYMIDGLIKASGSLRRSSWRVNISDIKFSNSVKYNRFQISGSLKGNSHLQWVIPNLHIVTNHNTADIKGEIGITNINIKAAINAPNLKEVLPKLDGAIKGFVKIYGAIEKPNILTGIVIKSLSWRDISIAYMRMSGNIKLSEQIRGKLDLYVKHITKPGVNINSFRLLAKDKKNQHILKLYLSSEYISGYLHFTGNFDRQTKHWKGHFDDAYFNTPVGKLILSQVVSLDYYIVDQKISIGPHCWINENTELCVPQTISVEADKGCALININNFNLATIKPFIPDNTKINGFINVSVDILWNNSKCSLPQFILRFSGFDVKLTQTVNEAQMTVEFDILSMNADLHDNSMQLDWMIRSANNGHFRGCIQVHDLQEQRNLNGIINVHNFNLLISNIILPQSKKIEGLLNANLHLTGNLQTPKLFGQIKLDGMDEGNFIPFDIRSSQLKMNFDGMSSSLAGELRTSQGKINLTGVIDWNQSNKCWQSRIVAKGYRVRINMPSMMQLDVSPNIVFKAKPGLFVLDGNIDVPWARVMVKEIPRSIIGISSDTILLNEKMNPIEKKNNSIKVVSNVVLNLGNNVRLDAFGLKTMLNGTLKVTHDRQGPRLNGKISISEGRFHAYGQDLIVRKGEMLFIGPLDQPILNIEAIRNPDITEGNVVAGVRVTGSANNPKLEIFSDSLVPQQEALSYLLRGQRLTGNQSDSAMMASILVGLEIAQSGHLVGKIGKTFGINNLILETQGAGKSSQLVVSGYIIPGLQIRYGVGIFNSLDTLTLRYLLMPKLYLEVVVGKDQVIDLVYQFEF